MPAPSFLQAFGCCESAFLVKTLFDTSCFTSTLTQVVQFSFTNSTTTFNSNAVNYRRVSLEDTLNAFAVGNFTNSEWSADRGYE